jgi:apolipoprotein N-acyltransferase
MIEAIQHFWGNKWWLSIAAGVLLGISFPPVPLPFLEFPAVIFILRIIDLSETAKQAATYSYPGFFIWNIIVSYWMMMATVAGGVAAIIANSLLMSLVVMLLFKAQEKLGNGWLVALLQTAFWVSFEYLHFHWPLSWPWLSLGNGWANATWIIQYISGTGFLGISFWVMLSSTLWYQVIRRKQLQYKIGATVITLALPIISLLMLPFISTQPENKIQVAAVQPNFNTFKPNGGYSSPLKANDHLLNLSDSIRTSDTRLILWPESGIYPYISNSAVPNGREQEVKNHLKEAASKWNTIIIGGTEYFNYFTNDSLPPLPRHDNGVPYLTYNAAVAFYPNGNMKVYRKHNLVPVIERMPFVQAFNKIDVFNWINWASIQQFGEGQKPTLFTDENEKFPVLICYDSIYPGWIRHFIQNGAGFITVITDDGWWGNSSGHIQHFDFDRLRAIEFRRWVVQDSNNGTSGVIAPDGSVIKRTSFGIQTAFRFDVPVLHQKTFYTRHGDWLPVSLLGISLAGIVLLIYIKLRA